MKRLLVILMVLIAFTAYGADVKISNLPEATTLADTDVFPVVAGTTTSKVQVTNLKTILATHAAITLSSDLGANLLGLSTQQLTLDNQTANYVFAGPTTGSAAAPAFRALVAADIPSLVATYQPLDGELTALAGLTSAANAIPYFTGSGTAGVISSSANMVSLLGSSDYATARGNLGVAIGTDVQGYNDDLTTLSTGGTAGCLWGEKSDASGIECKTTLNLLIDNTAAQFNDATDATKLFKIDPVGMTTGKTLTLKSSFDQSATLELKNTGLSADSKTITIDAACTDNCTITTPAATDTLVGRATTDTLTNKTLDVDGTGNVLKSWGYIVLTHPHLCAAGAPMQTTSTANTYGQCKFGNATDKATNYAEYYLTVPADIDTDVDLVGTFKIKLGGADTADHEYEISFDSVADSAAYAGSLGDAVSLAYTADGSGADGDVETATGTLTGWKAAMTAGQLFVIRVARDGDHGTDASTVDSYSGPLVIKYKITQ